MALPIQRPERIEFGTVGETLAAQHQEWPLPTAASLLVPYRQRVANEPDLDLVVSARTAECHVTPDLLQQRVYAPFAAEQAALPSPLLSAATSSHKQSGVLARIATVWVSTDQTTLLWDLDTNEVKELALRAEDGPVVDIACGAPNRDVFSDDVAHVLVVSTLQTMTLYAVDHRHQFLETGLSIPLGSGAPTVRVTAGGRVFFSCANSGTALWEFRYAAKESWFRAKTQKVCYGEAGGLFGGLFGTATRPDAEHVRDFVVDDEAEALYALTTRSAIHIYSWSKTGPLTQIKNFSASQLGVQLRQQQLLRQQQQQQQQQLQQQQQQQQAQTQTQFSFSGYAPATVLAGQTAQAGQAGPAGQPTSGQPTPGQPAPVHSGPANIVAVGAVSPKESRYIRLVAITSTGERLYFRCDGRMSNLALAYSHSLPAEGAVTQQSTVVGGRTTYAATGNRLLCAGVDDARVAHLADERTVPIAFVELCGWLTLDNPAVAVVRAGATDLVLTATSLFRVRARPFSARFEQDVPLALVPVYGAMQLCSGALACAAQPATPRIARERAIAAFFRLGGAPAFRRDQALLGHASIRLSASFDGLALLLAKIVQPIWDVKILDANLKAPKPAVLTDIHTKLTELVELLNRNRSFSEGMSGHTELDSSAILSQAEYKGLFALARLARSCQEGIAFLRLALSQHDARRLLAYFDTKLRPELHQTTYGMFFTQAKHSVVARELVNSLVNYVLSRSESVAEVAKTIKDQCSSYCSPGDVLEYEALECIHRAKQRGTADIALLTKSVALVRQAAGSIQLETLRDIIHDYVELGYFTGAVQAGLAVAAEQDPANLAIGFLRSRAAPKEVAENQTSDSVPATEANESKRLKLENGVAAVDPRALDHAAGISEGERKFLARMAVYNLLFAEVLNPKPALADVGCTDAAHTAMLNSPDEVWHFALYDWCLGHGRQDQIALLDTPFVAAYLELGASRDLRVATLLWKWHQRRGDSLAAADVLLDLARGPLVPTLSERVACLSRAQGYCQAQQDSFPSTNLLAMVRAYLGLALIQSDVLAELQKRGTPADALAPLNRRIYTISELYNEWAEPNGLYEVSFAIFAFADMRDPVEIHACWTNLLTAARAEDDKLRVQHYTHVAELVVRIGQAFRTVEPIFSLPKLVPFLEHYAVDYCATAPRGWLVDALLRSGTSLETLVDVYTDMLANKVLEGPYAAHAQESLEYAA